MKSDMTVSALGGVLERWDNDTLKIVEFVRNPKLYLDTKAGKRLKDIRKKYGTDMQSFPNMTNDEIKAIMVYIDTRYSH